MALSFPTPNTQELFRVVTRVAVGAPEEALALPIAPIAPDPFVPVVSMPAKLNTVIEDCTLCDRVAVTVTLVRTDGANARQISAEPACVLVRFTRTHVNPPPLIEVTERFVDDWLG